MSKKINKIVDNYPVLLDRYEKDNLVKTLSGIILEVAPGGSGGGKTYYGAEGVYVDNDNNRITLESTAKNAIDNIPHAVTDLTDSADYQLKSGMTNYLTTATYETDSATFLTKTSASQNLAPISVTADIEALKTNSGDFSQYYKKTDTSSKEELSAEFNLYQTKEDMVNYSTVQQVIDLRLDLENTISTKQPKLTFGYNENNAISSINDSALAGQGGTTYSAGAGIAIVDEYISLSADYIQAITSVSGKQDKLEFTYDTSGSIIKINNSAIAGGAGGGSVSYTGRNGVEINGNYIELETSAKNAIDSVAGISTDVGTLKTASASWNEVSAKLDSSVASTTYQTKADMNDYLTKSEASTTYQPTGNYLVADDITGKLDKSIYANASGNWEDTYSTVNQYSAAGTWLTQQSLTNYYQKTDTSSKTEITNALNTKVDKPISTQTGKLVYDGDTSAWVSLPAGTTIIVEGQGSVTANYNSSNSTYTVSLLASAENALTGVNDKIDTTAVAQTYQTKDDMTNYLTTSDAANTYQPKGNYAPETVTSTVNTLTGASASWNEVSAKLGTAQYANDSATFVIKPDTTQTVLNNNYLIYSTLTGEGTTTGWLPLSANYYSKSESDGRYAKASAALTSVSANTPLSGNGTTANPLGIDLTNAYTIDGTNGITAVPNSTTNKVVVQMTNDVWSDTQVVHSSISAWNEVSGLSAKSTVSANTATNVISISANSTATTANISATTYYTNTADSNLVAQRLFVVHNDADLVAHVQAGLCHGQGSLFFVMSGFNS